MLWPSPHLRRARVVGAVLVPRLPSAPHSASSRMDLTADLLRPVRAPLPMARLGLGNTRPAARVASTSHDAENPGPPQSGVP